MIEYLLLLLFNSLFITGIYTLFQENHLFSGIGKAIDNLLCFKIPYEKSQEMKAKGLWAKVEFAPYAMPEEGEHYAYLPIWKPIKGCYECMAGLWGTGFFFFIHIFLPFEWFEFSWNTLWILPVYLICLVAVNRLIGRWMDL